MQAAHQTDQRDWTWVNCPQSDPWDAGQHKPQVAPTHPNPRHCQKVKYKTHGNCTTPSTELLLYSATVGLLHRKYVEIFSRDNVRLLRRNYTRSFLASCVSFWHKNRTQPTQPNPWVDSTRVPPAQPRAALSLKHHDDDDDDGTAANGVISSGEQSNGDSWRNAGCRIVIGDTGNVVPPAAAAVGARAAVAGSILTSGVGGRSSVMAGVDGVVVAGTTCPATATAGLSTGPAEKHSGTVRIGMTGGVLVAAISADRLTGL